MAERRPSERGVTLLELLLVLAIMAGALALLAPFGSRLLAGPDPAAAARQMAAELKRARLLALEGQRDVLLSIDVGKGLYRLDGEAGRPVAGLAPGMQLTVKGETAADGAIVLRFQADGGSSGGAIAFRGERGAAELSIDWLTGRIGMRP